jgi:L-rhamnose mutarotase
LQRKNINYSEQIENCKSNIKQTWDVIKDLLSKNKCKSSYPESFKKKNTTISKEDEIAKEFNNFFSNIGQNLAKKFNKNNIRNYTKYLKSNYPKSLFLTRIITSELDKIIRELCPQKALAMTEFILK